MAGRMNAPQQRLAQENLGLVRAVLRSMGIRDPAGDWFEEGCVGLCRAALSWKEGGEPFSTYASHIIRHEIINRIEYENRLRRSGMKLCALDERPQGLFADDPGFSRVDSQLAAGAFLARFDSLAQPPESRAVRLLAQGMTAAQTAARLGMTRAAVSRVRKRAKELYGKWLRENEAAGSEPPAKREKEQ
jgi:RNA polymerase sigma factor (sigma-70 family)